MQPIVLTDREAELMQILWEHGPSTVTEVRALLPDDAAYTTVLTILRNLEAKEFVAHKEEGRAHRYTAIIAQESARRSALQSLSNKLFKGSAALLLTQLVSDEKLSSGDIRRLRALLNNRTRSNKP